MISPDDTASSSLALIIATFVQKQINIKLSSKIWHDGVLVAIKRVIVRS